MSRSTVRLLLASALPLIAVLLPATARAQDFTEAQRKVWASMKEARELNDLAELGKIAKKHPDETQGIYDVLEGQLAFADSLTLWEDLKVVGDALDQAKGDNLHKMRTDMLMKMSADQRKERLDARLRYTGIRANFYGAVRNRQKEELKTYNEQLQELAQSFAAMGDVEYQAYCLAVMADGFKESDQKLDAVKLYDQIDQALTGAGYRNWAFHGQVKTALNDLKAAGYDPNAKPGDENLPRGNTATSYSKDEAGQKWSEPESLKVYVSEDLPYKFTTPAYASGENTMVWQDWALNGNGPADFEQRFQPLGNSVRVSRDGAKLLFTIGEQKKPIEVTLSPKPQLIEVKREVTDVSGATNVIKYGFLVAAGGNQESRFGMSLNASPSATQYLVRYHSATYLKGKVLGQDLTIFDDNSTGRYGDPVRLIDGTNNRRFEFVFNDAVIYGKSKTAAPWTEFLEVDGAFYRLKLDPDNNTVVTRKLDVDTGTVKFVFKGPVKPDCVVIEETREFKGAFFALGKDPITVPVGLYRLAYGIIRQGTKASQDSCLILPGAETTAFQVGKGEEALVELGEPFTIDFETEDLPSGGVKVIGKSVVVHGKSGEAYCHFFDNPPIPDKVQLRAKGGSPLGKAVEMQRAVFADYQRDGAAVFQPLDVELPTKENGPYEVQISLKKHPFLGNNIKSEWKN